MKKGFVIMVVVAALGLGIGYPLEIGALKGIGAIASIGAFITGIIILMMLILKKVA